MPRVVSVPPLDPRKATRSSPSLPKRFPSSLLTMSLTIRESHVVSLNGKERFLAFPLVEKGFFPFPLLAILPPSEGRFVYEFVPSPWKHGPDMDGRVFASVRKSRDLHSRCSCYQREWNICSLPLAMCGSLSRKRHNLAREE